MANFSQRLIRTNFITLIIVYSTPKKRAWQRTLIRRALLTNIKEIKYTASITLKQAKA
jgi:hypothetical protein